MLLEKAVVPVTKHLEKKNNIFFIFILLILVIEKPSFANEDLLHEGKILSHFAGCYGCHTSKNNTEFSGGYEIRTKYGIFITPNITRDNNHGIGNWTESEFIKAIKTGVSPQNTPYYPSFPYVWFQKMSEEDIIKIFEYIKSLTPDNKKREKHNLKFPYNFRNLIWIWKILNEKISHSSETIILKNNNNLLSRGKYLTEVVGHCGACHSPRTWFSIVKNKSDLSGRGESFKNAKDSAPNITSAEKIGIGLWSESDIIFYLQTGIKPDGDFANEDMQSIIVDGTSHLSKKDLKAIATYLLK